MFFAIGVWVILAAASAVPAPIPPLEIPMPADYPGPAPALPEGELLLVSGKKDVAFFLDKQQSKMIGPVADIWIYAVYEPGKQIGKSVVVQHVQHEQINCNSRWHASLATWGYDQDGKMVVWLGKEPMKPTDSRSRPELFARVMCDGAQLPQANLVQGYRAASVKARDLIRQPGGPPLLESIP